MVLDSKLCYRYNLHFAVLYFINVSLGLNVSSEWILPWPRCKGTQCHVCLCHSQRISSTASFTSQIKSWAQYSQHIEAYAICICSWMLVSLLCAVVFWLPSPTRHHILVIIQEAKAIAS